MNRFARDPNRGPVETAAWSAPGIVARIAIATLASALLLQTLAACDRHAAPATPISSVPAKAPTFVASRTCAACHVAEFHQWQGSHHALAMQPASDAAVLGDFSHATFRNDGVASTFFRDGKRFLVRTAGPDGKPHNYPIEFTFGVYPLQQYLIPLSRGRLQASGIAWDSRPRSAGGQRWFAL